MVEARKNEQIIEISSVKTAEELVKEGGYTFRDEDTGRVIEDPIPYVEKYAGTIVDTGRDPTEEMEKFVKLCKEYGIFITMKE